MVFSAVFMHLLQHLEGVFFKLEVPSYIGIIFMRWYQVALFMHLLQHLEDLFFKQELPSYLSVIFMPWYQVACWNL